MTDERIDFKALDPWNDPERLRVASQSIVEAHGLVTRRAAFFDLLASLAPRAVLVAALATLLVWLLPQVLVQRTPPSPAPPERTMAQWVERGHVPTGLELLAMAEVAHEK